MWLRTVSRLSWSVSWICDVDAPAASKWSTSAWRGHHGRDLRPLAYATSAAARRPDDATLLADGDGADVREDAPPVRVGDLEFEVGRVLAVQLAEELLTGAAAVRRATTSMRCRPATSPATPRAAGLTHRMIP